MEKKVLTKHPARKDGVNISKKKYYAIRKSIVKCLRKKDALTYTGLAKTVGQDLKARFEGSIQWYVEVVKLDLKARKIIKGIPKSKPQLYRLISK